MDHRLVNQNQTKVAPNTTQAIGMIGQYAGETENALNALHCAIDTLATRLSPAVTDTSPLGNSPDTPKPISSPLGERLRAQAIGVQSAVSRLEELVLRLDL